MNNPEWKDYEIAVQKFLVALDPKAKVTHDVKIPDKHTGKPRQRDVFIEVNILGIIPVKILVSCKRYKRKLNESDIDHFNGELISSGAHKGVIYSYLGFNDSAIKKSKVLGISCFSLYKNIPPEIPDLLFFPNVYCCSSTLGLDVLGYPEPHFSFNTWGELFDCQIFNGANYELLVDLLTRYIREYEEKSVSEFKNRFFSFPKNYSFILEIIKPNPLRITVRFGWKFYKGELRGFLIDGAYSFTDCVFAGTQWTPTIDIKSGTQGDDWVLLEKEPEKPTGNYIVAVLHEADIKGTLMAFASKRITFVN